ncbi:hypothetical protein HY375_03220 [Candidatus Berkelbacteria bacterium]|nr:hypothetical protein [Candidatus Berkelbacteria bacterium]
MTRLLDHWLDHPLAGPSLLGLGAVALPVLAPSSELFWVIGILGLGYALWSARGQSRWHAAAPAIFIWALLALELRFLGVLPGAVSTLLFYCVSFLVMAWLVPLTGLRRHVIGHVLALGLVELLLVLFFWPINFPSRALVLTLAAVLGAELIFFSETNSLSWRAFAPSLGFTAVAIGAIVGTADWFGF